MKQEEVEKQQQLLLKDLSARIPYGVKIMVKGWDSDMDREFTKIETLRGIDDGFIYTKTSDKEVHSSVEPTFILLDYKPYLRPMSSMTEEEKVQLSQYACIGEDLNGEFIDEVQRKDCAAYVDWLNKNHFDYRGLIPMGLALEAPEGMYENKA